MVKIMTVEDSAFERKAIVEMLKKGKYNDVVEAETGEEAIKLFKENKADLVLMDLRLPGIDGLQCFEEIKKIDSKVKVIIITIVTRQEAVDKATKLGAKGYLIKPLTIKKLLEAVDKVIGKGKK